MSDEELEEGEIDEFGRHHRAYMHRADSQLDLSLDESDPAPGAAVDDPPSLGETLAGKSWGDLISLLQSDPAGINLHTGLTFDEVAKELEAKLQSLAAEGDVLMLYIRRMAATVKKMPMAPVLCLLMSAVNMTLRLRRYRNSFRTSCLLFCYFSLFLLFSFREVPQAPQGLFPGEGSPSFGRPYSPPLNWSIRGRSRGASVVHPLSVGIRGVRQPERIGYKYVRVTRSLHPCPPLARLLVAESAQFGIRVYEDRVQIQI